MRADRLVALLLLLQARGKVTAAEVAEELEVSERTARRDLEALGMAGIPVYPQQGRNGGWQLLGGARTDLSGLTANEARALFLVAGPSSTATPAIKGALRKLLRALPEPFRDDAEAASGAVVVDLAAWGASSRDRPVPTHLDALQHAVIEGQQVVLGYVARDKAASTRVVHPLGLATKSRSWYLVAGTDAGMRTFRVDRVTSVGATGDAVVRPEGFDLEASWRLITERVDDLWNPVRARATTEADSVGLLRMVFGNRLRIGPAAVDGRVEVEIAGVDERALAGELAGFGRILEIHHPPGIREHLAVIARELEAIYRTRSAAMPFESPEERAGAAHPGAETANSIGERTVGRDHLD